MIILRTKIYSSPSVIEFIPKEQFGGITISGPLSYIRSNIKPKSLGSLKSSTNFQDLLIDDYGNFKVIYDDRTRYNEFMGMIVRKRPGTEVQWNGQDLFKLDRNALKNLCEDEVNVLEDKVGIEFPVYGIKAIYEESRYPKLLYLQSKKAAWSSLLTKNIHFRAGNNSLVKWIANSKFINTSSPVENEILKGSGIEFSEDYTSFLKSFGRVNYFTRSIIGLNEKHTDDTVSMTEKLKKSIPEGLYVISTSAWDNLIFLQDSTGNVYKMKGTEKPRLEFKSLQEFLESKYFKV